MNLTWIGLGIGVMLFALIIVRNLICSLRRKPKRNQGNYFVGEGRHRAREAPPNPVPKAVPMATYKEVKEEYERRYQPWREQANQVLRRLSELERLNYGPMEPGDLLAYATEHERRNLAVILGVGAGAGPTEIVDALRKAGSHSLMSAMRGKHVTYEVVVKDVARKLDAKQTSQTMSAAELEKQAVGAAMEQMLAKASPVDREAILAELSKEQARSSTGLMTATGGLVLANLSGFGLYMAASSSLAAITGAVGLTLPFAVYTGLSSVLGFVTGPVGWASLALAAVFKFGGTEYKKTVPGVIAIASCRARLIASRDDEIDKLYKQRIALQESSYRLSILASFVKGMERVGTEHRVPRSSVPW